VEFFGNLLKAQNIYDLKYYLGRPEDVLFSLSWLLGTAALIGVIILFGDRSKLSRKLFYVLSASILVFSFFFCLESGSRGFFPFDQSIVFDGSYRIVSGQIPYRDFILPYGPVTFYIQALFFKLMGVNYFAYIFGAAVINVVTTFCVIVMFRLLFPENHLIACVAGLLTAVWFYPPSGTPYPEITAAFSSFLALTAILLASTGGKRPAFVNILLVGGAGCLAVFSFLSKQNAGALISPAYFVLIIGTSGKTRNIIRYLAFFLSGVILTAIGFSLWLHLFSDPTLFNYYFFKIPLQLGSDRLPHNLFTILRILTLGSGLKGAVFSIFIAISLIVIIFDLVNFKKYKEKSLSPRIAASAFCISLIGFQNLFGYSMNNQDTIAMVTMGIILALGLGLMLHLRNSASLLIRKPAPRRLTNATLSFGILSVVIIISVSSTKGANVSLNREVHDSLRASKFLTEHFSQKKLRNLKWGEPTNVDGVLYYKRDIANLYDYLEEEQVNFFIYTDFTFFYGLLGVPSPQPLVWFHSGLTYLPQDRPVLSDWMVDDLKKHDVKIVVLEGVSDYKSDDPVYLFGDFPRMQSYIKEGFFEEREIGPFIIYKKRRF